MNVVFARAWQSCLSDVLVIHCGDVWLGFVRVLVEVFVCFVRAVLCVVV